MPVPSSHAPSPPPAPVPGVRLVWGGAVGLAVVAAWFWLNSPWQDIWLNLLAVSICVLGVVPTLRWLQRHDKSYPLVELFQLTMVPFYAVPLLSEHQAIMGFSEDVLTKATLLVVVFQASALLGSAFSSRTFIRASESGIWKLVFVSDRSLHFTAYTMVSTSLWLLVANFTDWVPREYYGTFRAVFFGIGTLSNFIQARLWGSGQLGNSQKVL
ncbi:MAG: hypothetical protein HYV75_08075, partial [Opitutae bacterium]|nr:hypothetical protein [Opitutae bacterium]